MNLILKLFLLIFSNTNCIKETNPCGTDIYNGTVGCCKGLICYEETACIKNKNCTKFGNCYNKTST